MASFITPAYMRPEHAAAVAEYKATRGPAARRLRAALRGAETKQTTQDDLAHQKCPLHDTDLQLWECDFFARHLDPKDTSHDSLVFTRI